MKNSTFTIEEIQQLESMTKEELITSYKQYSSYTDNNLALLTNISTIDKVLYIGIMLKSMKVKDIVKEINLTKSHVSRLGKVGKWALNNKEQYQKLVDTAGTALSVRAIADAITHDTIKGVDNWVELVEAEKAYKESTKASAKKTPKATAKQSKPTSDKAPTSKPTQKHSFKIVDFERMNSTSMYSAVIRMVDAYKASGDNLEYMNAFITRLNELKH